MTDTDEKLDLTQVGDRPKEEFEARFPDLPLAPEVGRPLSGKLRSG